LLKQKHISLLVTLLLHWNVALNAATMLQALRHEVSAFPINKSLKSSRNA